MKTKHRYIITTILGIFVFILLLLLTWYDPIPLKVLPVLIFFIILIVFTTAFGVPISGGVVSLLPMSTIAAFLILGSIPAGWAAFLGAFVNEGIRIIFREQLGTESRLSKFGVIAVGAANAAIQTTSILVGGWVYRRIGGEIPFARFTFENTAGLLVLVLVYLATNLTLIGLYMVARGQRAIKLYLNSLDNLLLFEASPLVLLPLMPLIFTQLGFGILLLYSLTLVIASLISRSLALASRGLERRVQELDSLQAVGQALSSSLRLNELLPAIHKQVARLMPVDNFYVAFYYPDEDEVTFPLAYEEKTKVDWKPRKAGSGLTEYVLRRKQPLLISAGLEEQMSKLGIEQHGKMASSWLGVPILAGEESLGVIAVQSYINDERYDESHMNVLVTIAAQASIAIQNARLYERTDEALARRVQELNSILRTSKDGILLLSPEHQVLAANRALADVLEVQQTELSGGNWGTVQIKNHPRLLMKMGFSQEEFITACEDLESNNKTEIKGTLAQTSNSKRSYERTLTPVRDHKSGINGWLVVYRDITEEIELERLQEDMTHMLVHDLRSPLGALKGSLWLIRESMLDDSEQSPIPEMVAMAERNTDRMIGMVNSLLDIAQLEEGQLPLFTEAVDLNTMIEDLIHRLQPLLKEAKINLTVLIADDLPLIQVDPEHVRRVITNILDNAIKFTPNGGQIKLWADKDDDFMKIGIKDSGPGIPVAVQKRLFQKFQTNPKSQGRRRGTGLGLAYSKLVVEAHGGKIWVESEEGKGATFLMRLPIARMS